MERNTRYAGVNALEPLTQRWKNDDANENHMKVTKRRRTKKMRSNERGMGVYGGHIVMGHSRRSMGGLMRVSL